MPVVEREDVWEGARATRLLVGTSAGATSLTVTAGGLSSWGPVVHGRFPVVVARGTASEDHVYGTAIAGDQITGLEQVDGTPGMEFAHDGSATVEHGLFAAHVDAANQYLSAPTAAGQIPVSDAADSWGAPTATPALTPSSLVIPTAAGPSQITDGQAVWDSDDNVLTVGTGAGRKIMADTDSTQTLTSKTLVAPTIADLTNIQHDHLDTDDGGTLTIAAIPALTAAWTTYVPSLQGVTLGDGTLIGHYMQVGKTVHAAVYLLLGSTSAVTGVIRLGLPTAALATMAHVASWWALDTAGPSEYLGSGRVAEPFDSTGLFVTMLTTAAPSIQLNVGVPFSWGSGDTLACSITYEAA